jgi:hypothetical protein
MGFDWEDNRENTDEELAKAAARVMYSPTDRQTAPLAYVIEILVCPDEKGYTERDIERYILAALDVARTRDK